MPAQPDSQTLAAPLAEVKAGLQLKAGHQVIVVVDGAQGTSQPWVDPDEAEEEPGPGKKADAGDEDEAAGDGKPPGDGAEEEAKEDEDAEAGDAKPSDPNGEVLNLRWSMTEASDGDQVEMLADVKGNPKVLFTLELKNGADPWKAVGSLNATVAEGVAKATTRLDHPGSNDDVHFRFRARTL